jgi:hypothetical protein
MVGKACSETFISDFTHRMGGERNNRDHVARASKFLRSGITVQDLHLRESWLGSDFPHSDCFQRMPESADEPGDDLPGDIMYLPIEYQLISAQLKRRAN